MELPREIEDRIKSGKEKAFTVENEGFDLTILDNNTEDLGVFLVDSKLGHDAYSHNTVSEHTYYVMDGEGVFEIDDEEVNVKAGDKISIQPNSVFYYEGDMEMVLVMQPNFDEKNHVVDKEVSYGNQETQE